MCIFARERRGERLRVGDQRSGMAAHARLSCLASDQRSSGRLPKQECSRRLLRNLCNPIIVSAETSERMGSADFFMFLIP